MTDPVTVPDDAQPHVEIAHKWAQIPEDLLYDPEIPADAVRVYGVLVRHGSDPHNCYPSNRRIGDLIGKAARSVPAWIRTLEDAGWVERVPRSLPDGTATSNGYRVFGVRAGERGTRAVQRGGSRATERGGPAPESAPNESHENESNPERENATLPEVASQSSSLDVEIESLCDLLADHVAQQRDQPRPKIGPSWRRDFRLLIERGPLGVEGVQPVEPEHVRQAIGVIFTELSEREGSGGFCWADQIRSPLKLRKYWHECRSEVRAKRGQSPSGMVAGVLERRKREGRSRSPWAGPPRSGAIDATASEATG